MVDFNEVLGALKEITQKRANQSSSIADMVGEMLYNLVMNSSCIMSFSERDRTQASEF